MAAFTAQWQSTEGATEIVVCPTKLKIFMAFYWKSLLSLDSPPKKGASQMEFKKERVLSIEE